MNTFFYGLFMDSEVLMKNGINPSNPRKAYLNNYTLRIGQRASLVPCEGEKSYEIVTDVNKEQITSLYAEESVADYIPEQVEVVRDLNERIRATCYNLSPRLIVGTNAEYARSLHSLASKTGISC